MIENPPGEDTTTNLLEEENLLKKGNLVEKENPLETEMIEKLPVEETTINIPEEVILLEVEMIENLPKEETITNIPKEGNILEVVSLFITNAFYYVIVFTKIKLNCCQKMYL